MKKKILIIIALIMSLICFCTVAKATDAGAQPLGDVYLYMQSGASDNSQSSSDNSYTSVKVTGDYDGTHTTEYMNGVKNGNAGNGKTTIPR